MHFQLAKVIGHRGACGYAPENTLISMSKAHELGVTWVEFDVMLAKSGEPIIFHDDTLERTTNGLGMVKDMDLQMLATLDCGSWFSKDYIGQKIPTLCDLLTHVASLNLAINVEIKPYPGDEWLTTHKTLEVLQSHWPSTSPIPLISSFSPMVLKAVRQSGFDYQLGYIIDEWDENIASILEEYHCISLHVDQNLLTPERVKKIKDLQRFVLAYTVNDIIRARELFSWGVDAVFTDYPDIILSEFGGRLCNNDQY